MRKSIDRIGVDGTVLVEVDTDVVEVTDVVEAEGTVLADGFGDAQLVMNIAATLVIRSPRIAEE